MVKASKKQHLQNGYSGWPGSEPLPTSASHVHISDVDPQSFWRDYISTRKPVVISGHISDSAWKATGLWTDEYLTNKAGGVRLEVEERASVAEGYGKGKKVGMTFAECLRRMSDGDTSLYLTTQKVAVGDDGHPEVLGPPLLELSSDFPVRPALLGNLIPQQVNVWAGCAPEGSSTGLHHDYHDNLYVLLRGKKRFRLYPPSWADRMYVHGSLAKVHPNGRIVHKSQGDVLADGSDAGEVAQWEARRAAELELKAAEEALARGEEGARERLAAAEQRLDEALEAALDGEEGEEDGWDLRDDFDAMTEAEEEGEGGGAGPSKGAADTGSAGDPDSFSKVDLSRPAAELRKEFPHFPGVSAALVCEVSAGEMLFVPAGWFHEVTSFSAPDSPTHLALNYWCHPPDNLDASPAGFGKPYRSDYWPEVWAGRAHKYEPPQPPADVAAAAGAAVAEAGAGEEEEEEEEKEEEKQEEEQRGQEEQGGGKVGHGKAEAARAPESKTPELGQLQRKKRPREEEEEAEAPQPPKGLKARLVQQLYGLFGFGRRQFLHRFVGIRNVQQEPEQQE